MRGRIPTGKQIQIFSAFNREIVLDGSLFTPVLLMTRFN